MVQATLVETVAASSKLMLCYLKENKFIISISANADQFLNCKEYA